MEGDLVNAMELVCVQPDIPKQPIASAEIQLQEPVPMEMEHTIVKPEIATACLDTRETCVTVKQFAQITALVMDPASAMEPALVMSTGPEPRIVAARLRGKIA